MIRARLLAAALPLPLAGCMTIPPAPPLPPAPIEVQVLAFNDFHGNLEPPAPVEFVAADGTTQRVQTGGAARLGARLQGLRTAKSVTVSAGDTIGATPLPSALFLDEPTILAMNKIGLEYNAVGNHEFDKGLAELQRIQAGGCVQHTRRQPCALEPFAGAKFRYLGANVLGRDGRPVMATSGLKRFGPVTLGFIGMTLKGTANLVTPSGVAGLSFADEAETANALVPALKAQGADAIVLLIHEGGKTARFGQGNDCDRLSGAITNIVARLDPAITTIVSGHTHWAYVCPSALPGTATPRLTTSAGKNGYLVTDIRLSFDPATRALIGQRATNALVGAGEHGEQADVAALVARTVAAAAPLGERIVGTLAAPAPRDEEDHESPAANLIADAMLAATRKDGAELALVNATGVRVGLPAGPVRYADAFRMMPFGNGVVTMSLTGAEIRTALEQQLANQRRAKAERPSVLAVSDGVTYRIDMARAPGNRVVDLRLGGRPLDPARRYRVAMNNYLASGGDGISVLTRGTDVRDSGIADIDALIAWIAGGRAPPGARIAIAR